MSGNNEETKVSALLEQTGKLVGFLSALTVALSVIFDWTFLSALGISFMDVPTSLQDHVRSAIIWAPGAGLALLAIVGWEAYKTRVKEITPSLREDLSKAVARAPLVWLNRYKIALVEAALVLGIVGITLFAESERWVYIEYVLFWFLFVVPVVRTFDSLIGVAGFVYLPLVALIIAFHGHAQGEELLGAEAKWSLTIVSHGGQPAVIEATGVRRFSEAVVTVDTNRKVSVIPAERVMKVARITSVEIGRSRACNWLGIWCPPERTPVRL